MGHKTSQTGVFMIKSFEGCRLTAYKAAPTEIYWTIGWGHYGPDVKPGMTITQAEADEILVDDVAVKGEKYVNDTSFVPISAQLNQNQFDALVSFCFNCGGQNLKTLCSGRTLAQIAEHITAYDKSSGKPLAGLTRRRAAELELFNKPITEDEDAMTAAEKAALEALQNTVAEQAAQIKRLVAASSMPVPSWAEEAVEAAVEAKLINTPNGRSEDFYSLVTVLHRKGII